MTGMTKQQSRLWLWATSQDGAQSPPPTCRLLPPLAEGTAALLSRQG